jgi:hypothetical protein
MEANAKEWIRVNKDYIPATFISPDGRFMLIITNEEYNNKTLIKRSSEVICLEDLKSKQHGK